jgi:outer membrane protein insertion porin family
MMGQGLDLNGRPVAKVDVEGLQKVAKQLVLNQVRTKVGDPYDAALVAKDIQNITRLGRFGRVRVEAGQNEDGTVNVIYVVAEQAALEDVQVVGNKALDDQELLKQVVLRKGDPEDTFLINRGKDQLTRAYRKAGYFLADVSVDEQSLADAHVLVYRVREGPRVKVRQVKFEGNTHFTRKQLQSKIATKKHVFIFSKGQLSQEQLDEDVSRVRQFYNQHGYLDVRVGRRIQLSENQKDASVVFFIDEGRQYVVGEIDFDIDGKGVFNPTELRDAMSLKSGDVYSLDKVRQVREDLANLYGRLGYLQAPERMEVNAEDGSTRIGIIRTFDETEPRVDLKVTITEGRRYIVGDVVIRGNALTQDKVVRRELRGLDPGRYYDRPGIKQSERRIKQSSLFSDAKLTVQGEPDQQVRDLLVEVKEARTGSISVGAAISSDAGLFGGIDLKQRNFDITDTPETIGEFFTGQAFRGAGQYFAISLQPGNEVSQYSVTFAEPYINDSDYFMRTNAFFRDRAYGSNQGDYDEQRLGGTVALGKRFGDVWSAQVSARFEKIEISDITANSPVDLFAVAGSSDLDSFGFNVTRSALKVDDALLAYGGSRLDLGIQRYGLITGDYQFTQASASYSKYWLLDQDFFGRKTTLRFKSTVGYIFEDNEAPLFERLYAGGHNTFRGFRYRGVSPRGLYDHDGLAATPPIQGSDPVGGEFLFLAGTEYNFPVWSSPSGGGYSDILRGVVFVDTGTVDTDASFDAYRVAVGAGIRLNIPMLGQAPFAFDFAFPLVKEDEDDVRVFSFSIALPF